MFNILCRALPRGQTPPHGPTPAGARELNALRGELQYEVGRCRLSLSNPR